MKLTTNATVAIFEEMNREPKIKALLTGQHRAYRTQRPTRRVALLKAWDRRFRVEACRLGFAV